MKNKIKEVRTNLADYLYIYRKTNQLSEKQMAELLIPEEYTEDPVNAAKKYGTWENGVHEPSPAFFKIIVKKLNCDFEDIMGEAKPPQFTDEGHIRLIKKYDMYLNARGYYIAEKEIEKAQIAEIVIKLLNNELEEIMQDKRIRILDRTYEMHKIIAVMLCQYIPQYNPRKQLPEDYFIPLLKHDLELFKVGNKTFELWKRKGSRMKII
jgi:transcriptional regulator with XRE-family HTH domain